MRAFRLCGYHPPLFNQNVGPYAPSRQAFVNPYFSQAAAADDNVARHAHFVEDEDDVKMGGTFALVGCF